MLPCAPRVRGGHGAALPPHPPGAPRFVPLRAPAGGGLCPPPPLLGLPHPIIFIKPQQLFTPVPPLFPRAPGLPAGGVVLYCSNRHREAEEKRHPRPSSCPLPVSGASTFPPCSGGLFALFFYSFQPLCPSVPTVFYMCVHTVTGGREAAKEACSPLEPSGVRGVGGAPSSGPPAHPSTQ